MTAIEQAVQQTLREYIAACNAGDADAYKATLAPDVVFCPRRNRQSGVATPWVSG